MRSIERYIVNLNQVHRYAWWFVKCVLLFKQPLKFLSAYLTQTAPKERVVELRDGLKIYLSEHPHDVVTVFVVFVKEDYGDIPEGSEVLDVGGNIGVFSLYAAHKKAAHISVYEPNSEAFRVLERNIVENKLSAVISAYQLAVTSVGGRTVKFPKKASMYNQAISDDAQNAIETIETETVGTESIAAILSSAQQIDLWKMDCEGGEYDILFGSTPEIFEVVREIRMEYHGGKTTEIERLLNAQGFVKNLHRADGENAGMMWFSKINSNRSPQTPIK
jgi:FkbM family methyltransferase